LKTRYFCVWIKGFRASFHNISMNVNTWTRDNYPLMAIMVPPNRPSPESPIAGSEARSGHTSTSKARQPHPPQRKGREVDPVPNQERQNWGIQLNTDKRSARTLASNLSPEYLRDGPPTVRSARQALLADFNSKKEVLDESFQKNAYRSADPFGH